MKFSYGGKLSAGDLALFQLASWHSGVVSVIYVIFIVCLMLVPAFLVESSIFSNLLFVIPLGIFFFVGIQYFLLQKAAAKAHAFTVTIDDEGILAASPGIAKTNYEWTAFKYFIEMSGRLFLFFESNQALIIPQRLLATEEQWLQLKEFIITKVPAKKVKKRTALWPIALLIFIFTPFLYQVLTAPKLDDQIVMLREDDPRVIEATNQAQASLDSFITQLNNRDPKYTYSLKTVIGEAEHIWVQVESYNEGVFVGYLANEPFMEAYNIGDRIEVPRSEVEDWTIRDEKWNILKGGFSIELLKDTEK